MIKITADSTCDLSQQLIKKYNIAISPLHVLVDEEDYIDGVTITPNDLFKFVENENKTCSTTAVNTYEYEQFFSQFAETHEAIIHISLGMDFSSLYFAREKCRELQRKMQSVATQYFPYFLDNAFVKRKLWPVYEIIWAW